MIDRPRAGFGLGDSARLCKQKKPGFSLQFATKAVYCGVYNVLTK
jgi:hypothetical protein